MIRFFSRMLKLPVSVFVSGMEILVRSMQDAQRTFEKGVDDMVREFVGNSEANSDGAGKLPIDTKFAEGDLEKANTSLPFQPEEKIMYGDDYCEPDLSNDDVKNLTYWISFLKPNYVATLQERRDRTIDYSTTAQSFASERYGEFLDTLHTGGIPVPSDWRDLPSPDYVTATSSTGTVMLIEIPQRDRRYIDVRIEENWRRPRSTSEYDKQQVDVLKEIRDRL